MEAVLRQSWLEDLLPLLQDRSISTRVGRAGLFGVVGAVVGEIADMACQAYFKRKLGIGTLLGAAGAAVGAFSPEIMDWAAAYERLDADQREYVDERVRKRVVSQELIEQLSYFDLPPTATADELRKAWKRKAAEFHPDRNKASDAHVRFVALNAAHERLRDAYACGELPLAV
jgi:hypothetical protein